MSETHPRPLGVDIEAFEELLTHGAIGVHREILRSVPGATFFVFDTDLRFVFAEGAALRRRGVDPRAEFEGRTVGETLGDYIDVGALSRAYRAALRGETSEFDHGGPNGVHWVHVAPVRNERGEITRGIATSVDVTAQREAEERLQRHAMQQAATARLGRRALEGASVPELLHAAADAVVEAACADTCSILSVEEAPERLVLRAAAGWPEDVVRAGPSPWTHAERRMLIRLADGPILVEDASTWEPGREVLQRLGVASLAVVLVGPAERPWGFLGAESFTPRRFTSEEADFLQTIANTLWDAIERREAEEAYRHAALHDELTGLPNLRQLREHLDGALERARASGGALSVLLLDLNNFKVVNDSVGHAGGDELLGALAPRLRAAARPADMVARIGGDEFVIVAEDVIGEPHALELAESVERVFDEPLEVGDHRYTVTASLGLVIASGTSAAALLRDADVAMYRAKHQGGGLQQFSPAMRRSAVARMRTEVELRRAIEGDELRLHYQPLYATADRRLLGLEALVRWAHPRRGLIAPGEFIPLAEQTGLIVPIGEWVLGVATRRLGDWQRRFPCARELVMSVNVSARQLLRSTQTQSNLVDVVRAAISDGGIGPDRLALEVTESMLMDAAEESQALLAELQALGVRILADDFGTGYSSLSRLTEIPLDTLKIDRSFVGGLTEDSGRDAIVATIIAMAKTLGLGVIAEGVETDAQLRPLTELGCEVAQGFLLSRPLPEEAVTKLLAERPHDLAA